ncbi:MAG: hypothetical protein KJZ80_00680 [Hyphomicrobiaceae bacterium]|nr:hypothetical protein [Hyphomicrobiaceae bacterium]
MSFLLVLIGLVIVSAGAAGQSLEWNVDRLGGDYANFPVAADPRHCQAACQQDQRCRAWTYVQPGVQGPQPRCWLKHVVPQPLARNCCISGVKNVLYKSRWDKLSGPGGDWTTGWVPNHTQPVCGHFGENLCGCDPNSAACGTYSHGQSIVAAPYGCHRPERWIIRCTSVSQEQ